MDLIFLRVFKGDKLIEVKQFPLAQVVIGREGDVNLKLSDPEISPVHTVIEKRDSGFFVCDMGSGSGTFKNGMRVLDEPLVSGDEIIVGGYRIEFHIGVPKPAAKPATPPPPAAPPKRELPKEVKIEAKSEIPPKKAPKKPEAITIPVMATIGDTALEAFSVPPTPGTYAPESEIKDLNKVIKPSQGNVVQIMVAWKERILHTYQFSEAGKVIMVGAHPKNDILLPVFTDPNFSFALLKIGNPSTVFITSDMRGELRVGESGQKLQDLIALNKLRREGVGFALDLQQNNLVRVEIGEVTIFIRYVNETPKPLPAPLLFLTSSELTTLVLTSVFFGVYWIYLLLYTPPPPEEKPDEEPKRTAVFVYKRQERIEPVEEKPAQKAKGETIKDQEVAKSRIEEGKAAEAKPNKSKSEVQKLTTDTPGQDKGIQKAATNVNKADSAPAKKDVSKLGLGGVFGKNGLQQDIDKAASGSGVVGNIAKNSSGTGGQNAAGAGDEAGLGMKDIGKGGTGTATVGIGGIGTSGRGGGREGYGTGPMGGKRNATIIAGGEGEEFEGNIDREGIRRVIKENERQFRACYEKVLNKRPDLFGKITISWDINDRGRVVDARIKSSTVGNSEVEQCMLLRLRVLKFPESPPNNTAAVSFPWVFNSK